MAGGPTAWFIDGQSGIATWRQEEYPAVDPSPSCRPFIIDITPTSLGHDIATLSPPRKTWLNVEMTAYARFSGLARPNENETFMRLSARSNHFNILNCNCDGLGYDFNLIGNPTHSYAYLVNKEIVHDTYGTDSDHVNVAQSHFTTIPSYSRFGDVQRFPFLRWVGMKFVVRNMANGHVRLEAYRDMTDGNSGGNWVKLADIEDDGIDGHWGAKTSGLRAALDAHWASAGGCSNIGGVSTCIEPNVPKQGNYNPLITRAGYACYIRISVVRKVDLKKFSVREIDPL